MTYQEIVILVIDFMKNSNLTEEKFMPADEKLIKEVGQYLGFNVGKYIKVVPVETSNRLILGYFRHFKHGAEIGINRDALNDCWRRFVITKELSHLIMSKSGEGITQNMEDLVNGLFQMNFGLSDDIDHENLALLLASEYLMPYGISQPMLKTDPKELPDLEIAKIFGVPEGVIKAYRKEDHLADRDEAYKDIYTLH